ncbi:DUF3306 domain-containing protein [Yoonia sp.]|uniref:DUF3306 domain-containing protein n=1 Tax=Yoonia sp. TaxID=2212373 RepID=UPI001A0EE5F9|nr:DUF3306 domain-containing protein [Yoonia sp.]MBE0413144.1 DUF3306 domain-containing protein [Yoonia sp.]
MNVSQTDFWSRRKAKVAQEAEAEEVVQDLPQEDLTDAEILAKFDLPDPESLKLGDDIKGFMSRAVPEHLRRRALRKLWRTNPVLACLDGLNDYEDDFTDAATVMPGMKTAYQVGKGMLAHLQDVAQKADELLAADDHGVDLDQVEKVQDMPSSDDEPTVVAKADAATAETPQPVVRRMRFEFEQDATS